MAKLKNAVVVVDPDKPGTRVWLMPGEEPEPRLAKLITNPDAWEDGILPATAESDSNSKDDQSDEKPEDTKPAATKRAARKPARGRSAAGEGDSGS